MRKGRLRRTFHANHRRACPTCRSSNAETAQNDSSLIGIVDDDEDLRRILARMAPTKAVHRVIEAETGDEGLRMVAERRPDLVVLDLFMPPPDGFEVLRTLRSNEATRLLPVVVLTAHGDEEGARKSFDAGATDFLAKPFTPPQLDARVRACFAHSPRQ